MGMQTQWGLLSRDRGVDSVCGSGLSVARGKMAMRAVVVLEMVDGWMASPLHTRPQCRGIQHYKVHTAYMQRDVLVHSSFYVWRLKHPHACDQAW